MPSTRTLGPLAAAFSILGGALLQACATRADQGGASGPAWPAGMEVGVDHGVTGADADVQALLREPLDADRAVEVALLGNRELRARLRELGIGRGRLVQARLVANPTLEVESLPERDASYEVRIEYEISSLILAPRRARAAAADLDADRHAVASAVVRLGFDVRQAIYDLERAEQRLAVARDGLEVLAASRDAAQEMVAAGNVDPMVAASAEAAYARAEVAVSESETAVVGARERVRRLLGLGGAEREWDVVPTLPGLPDALPRIQEAESRAVRSSHDLASLSSQRRAAGARKRLARLEGWLPEIALDAHALRANPEAGGDPMADDSWRFGGGIALSLPIFDRQQGAVLAHQATSDGLDERIQGLTIELRSAVRVAEERRRTSYERARRYADAILPAEATVMERTVLQYNAMQLGVFELLRARQAYLEAQLAYVDALHEYWSADAALRALTDGTNIGTNIESSPRPAAREQSTRNDPRGEH